MEPYVEKIIREVSNRYLEEIALAPTIDVEKLSASRREAWKKQASRTLKSELFQYIVKDLSEQVKNILLLKSTNQESVLVNRGFLLGLQAVQKNLQSWCAGGSILPEDED
jgi:hypothetical protein